MKDLHDEGAVTDHTRVTSRNVPTRRYKHVTPDEHAGARRHMLPLRCIQITDPHLGCFMTPQRLAQICERTVEANPDLVFLAGDFFTVEGMREPTEMLTEALRPLRKLGPNKVYACLGNHDVETAAVNDTVRQAVAAIGARLLVDESLTVETRLGSVQISGFNYCKQKQTMLSTVVNFYRDHPLSAPIGANLECPAALLHICLLHDPNVFGLLPRHALPTLVLSGHTHGGHLGLFSLGWRHATVMRLFGHYDNGLWRNKGNAMWVHRGQGSRSLMGNLVTRCGVPTEDSVFHIYA